MLFLVVLYQGVESLLSLARRIDEITDYTQGPYIAPSFLTSSPSVSMVTSNLVADFAPTYYVLSVRL